MFITKKILIILIIVNLNINILMSSDYYSNENIVQSSDDDEDDYTLDLAIKLKPEYADEVVSDLFATAHNLRKIAKVCIN
jgi:hypothetical protein